MAASVGTGDGVAVSVGVAVGTGVAVALAVGVGVGSCVGRSVGNWGGAFVGVSGTSAIGWPPGAQAARVARKMMASTFSRRTIIALTLLYKARPVRSQKT